MKWFRLTTLMVLAGAVGCGAAEGDEGGEGFGSGQQALTVRIEAEAQTWSTSGGDTISPSTTVRMNANAVGDFFRFASPVTAGTYQVALRYSQRNSYGDYRVNVNGAPVATLSGYGPTTGDTWRTVSLGTLNLSGNVEFEFTVTGKSASSSDHDFKIDYIELSSVVDGGTGGSSGAGGSSAGGSAGSSSGGTSGATSAYPCDGTTSGYTTVMAKSGSTWTVTRGAARIHTGSDMRAALIAAYGSLSAGRTSKQSILVQGSGDIGADQQVSIPSYTLLNVCGTVNVSGSPSGSDRSPFYARNAREIEIPNLKMTGSPQYGIFMRSTDNVKLGRIDLRLSSSAGTGIRVDSGGNAGSSTAFNSGLTIDYVYGTGMGSHVVETYGISNIQIGTVEGNAVGECGLLLNRSINARVGLVSCTNCGTGTGYAAFRVANSAGKVGSTFPRDNIKVGKVVARGGGRGIFSVSGSGGLTVDEVDIANTGNNPILLQNAYNTTIAGVSGKIVGGSITLSNDTTNTNSGKYPPSQNVALRNLTLSGGASVRQDWCAQYGANGCTATNITGGSVSMCR
ncbi:MAG: hypothetical protein EOO73_13790 [Myxococcales bacterium]|nr:MAG: hypothetical protein EOO73_13790 [Myxococcales bacterium]